MTAAPVAFDRRCCRLELAAKLIQPARPIATKARHAPIAAPPANSPALAMAMSSIRKRSALSTLAITLQWLRLLPLRNHIIVVIIVV
jgi:hypothetical protein